METEVEHKVNYLREGVEKWTATECEVGGVWADLIWIACVEEEQISVLRSNWKKHQHQDMSG